MSGTLWPVQHTDSEYYGCARVPYEVPYQPKRTTVLKTIDTELYTENITLKTPTGNSILNASIHGYISLHLQSPWSMLSLPTVPHKATAGAGYNLSRRYNLRQENETYFQEDRGRNRDIEYSPRRIPGGIQSAPAPSTRTRSQDSRDNYRGITPDSHLTPFQLRSRNILQRQALQNTQEYYRNNSPQN